MADREEDNSRKKKPPSPPPPPGPTPAQIMAKNRQLLADYYKQAQDYGSDQLYKEGVADIQDQYGLLDMYLKELKEQYGFASPRILQDKDFNAEAFLNRNELFNNVYQGGLAENRRGLTQGFDKEYGPGYEDKFFKDSYKQQDFNQDLDKEYKTESDYIDVGFKRGLFDEIKRNEYLKKLSDQRTAAVDEYNTTLDPLYDQGRSSLRDMLNQSRSKAASWTYGQSDKPNYYSGNALTNANLQRNRMGSRAQMLIDKPALNAREFVGIANPYQAKKPTTDGTSDPNDQNPNNTRDLLRRVQQGAF